MFWVKVVARRISWMSRSLSSAKRRGSFRIARTSARRIESGRWGVLGDKSFFSFTPPIGRIPSSSRRYVFFNVSLVVSAQGSRFRYPALARSWRMNSSGTHCNTVPVRRAIPEIKNCWNDFPSSLHSSSVVAGYAAVSKSTPGTDSTLPWSITLDRNSWGTSPPPSNWFINHKPSETPGS